jgi:poly-D-alanine transfer protein DltD
MASRAELKRICKELKIDPDKLTITEMKEKIKETANRLFLNKKYKIGSSKWSDDLIKFLTLEYDYKLVNRKGKQIK